MRDFYWAVNCYICLFKITNSKSKKKLPANCINALQRKHMLTRKNFKTVSIILKKWEFNMCDNRTVIMFFRYHWKFSRKKIFVYQKKKMHSTEWKCYKTVSIMLLRLVNLKDIFFISIKKCNYYQKYFAYVNVLFERYMAESHFKQSIFIFAVS